MATDLRQLPAFLGDDATFRQWGQGIHDQIANCGLVQTSDTGQINWTSVARPATATMAGYEIWRFNDSLQATKPVFIRVEYWIGAGANDRPGFVFNIGTGVNGAGVLTGQLSTASRWLRPSASKGAGTTLPSYCSGTTSRLNLATHLDPTVFTTTMMALVERTKTADGTETGDGIIYCGLTPTSGLQTFQVIPFSGSIPAVATTNLATSITAAGISSVGPNIALSPTIAPLGRAYFASWCAYVQPDLGNLQAFNANHLGASHTFMALGALVNSVQGANTNHSLAILWE